MWIDVENGKLYVEVAGDGEPILLVHGWPLDHRIFSPQVRALRESLTTITFDRRGFGRSEAKPDLRLELDDIDRILDTLGLPQVHLLGMSQGGRIALRYAATRTRRVRSLLLQGAVVDGLDVEEGSDDRVPINEYATLARGGGLPDVINQWLQHPMMWLGDDREQEHQLLRTILEDYKGIDLIEYHPEHYVFEHDVLAAMTKFCRPTLLLTGARETASRRKHSNVLMRRIPDCREVVFSDSGHMSNLSEPELYNQAVISFCESVSLTEPPSTGAALD